MTPMHDIEKNKNSATRARAHTHTHTHTHTHFTGNRDSRRKAKKIKADKK